jgi:hypothetical protein
VNSEKREDRSQNSEDRIQIINFTQSSQRHRENETRHDLQDQKDFTDIEVLFQRHHKVMVWMIFHPDL